MSFESNIYPYTWNERFLLKGKTYREKSSKKEYRIFSFTITDKGVFMINGIPSQTFLEQFELLDGKPCGIKMEERMNNTKELLYSKFEKVIDDLVEIKKILSEQEIKIPDSDRVDELICKIVDMETILYK